MVEEGTLNANKKITIKFIRGIITVSVVFVRARAFTKPLPIIKQYNIIMMMMIVTDDAWKRPFYLFIRVPNSRSISDGSASRGNMLVAGKWVHEQTQRYVENWPGHCEFGVIVEITSWRLRSKPPMRWSEWADDIVDWSLRRRSSFHHIQSDGCSIKTRPLFVFQHLLSVPHRSSSLLWFFVLRLLFLVVRVPWTMAVRACVCARYVCYSIPKAGC